MKLARSNARSVSLRRNSPHAVEAGRPIDWHAWNGIKKTLETGRLGDGEGLRAPAFPLWFIEQHSPAVSREPDVLEADLRGRVRPAAGSISVVRSSSSGRTAAHGCEPAGVANSARPADFS